MYESEGKKKVIQCYAYDDVVHRMTGGNDDITAELLLKAAQFDSITLNKGDKKIIIKK